MEEKDRKEADDHDDDSKKKKNDLKTVSDDQTKECKHSVLGDEGKIGSMDQVNQSEVNEEKGKEVAVPGTDSVGRKELKKQIADTKISVDLRTITGSGSDSFCSMKLESSEDRELIKQAISELVRKMKGVTVVRKRLIEISTQSNMPDHALSSKEVTENQKRKMMMTEVTISVFQRRGDNLEDVDSDHHDVKMDHLNPSGVESSTDGGTEETEGKGKDVVVSEECQELIKKQSDVEKSGVGKTTTESESSDADCLDREED